jgi:uncharacterized protein YbjT (DUF2867 family)
MRILVAGATGTLGRHVVRSLKEHGHTVRALARSGAALAQVSADEIAPADLVDADALAGVCRDVDAVISCAGASLSLNGFGRRRGFMAVDHAGNRNLLREARREGVARFVYVSLHGADRLMHTEFARAHECFVEELARSGLAHTVVRPTGFFAFLVEVLKLAQHGRGLVIGDGAARTNPVHEADVAGACVRALQGGEQEMEIGGPETFTRSEIVALALEVAGKRARITRVPSGLMRMVSAPLRPVNPRIHALLHFGIEVSSIDMVAPAVGTRRLRPYFEALVGGGAAPRDADAAAGAGRG